MIALLPLAASAADPNRAPCDAGPTQAWLWDGMLGLAQSTCAETRVGFAPRGLLVADTPNFYGRISTTWTLDAALALDERTQVGLALEAFHTEAILGAIGNTWSGYGATTVTGMHRVERDGEPLALAMVGRVVLPSQLGWSAHPTLAGDLGFAASSLGDGPLSSHGQLGLAVSGGLGTPVDLRSAIVITAGEAWTPSRHFGLVLDLQAATGYYAPLDHLAVAPAVRLGGRAWAGELGATVPALGRERALAAVRLGVSLRPERAE